MKEQRTKLFPEKELKIQVYLDNIQVLMRNITTRNTEEKKELIFEMIKEIEKLI